VIRAKNERYNSLPGCEIYPKFHLLNGIGIVRAKMLAVEVYFFWGRNEGGRKA
jgi:hypothetical protein